MKTNDLQVGEVYGRLTLLAKSDTDGQRSKGTHQRWTFRCSCGNVKVTRPYFVVKGRTTSCGCYNREVTSKPKPERRLPNGLAAAKQLWHGYVRGAKMRGLVFEISFEDFLIITKLPCRYCSEKPFNYTKSQSTYRDQYLHNGIDRVDNEIGYTLNNCAACCKICNNAKKEMTVEDFEAWIDKLVATRSRFCSPRKGT